MPFCIDVEIPLLIPGKGPISWPSRQKSVATRQEAVPVQCNEPNGRGAMGTRRVSVPIYPIRLRHFSGLCAEWKMA